MELSDQQRAQVVAELRYYLAGWQQRGIAFQRPTWQRITSWQPRQQEGYASVCAVGGNGVGDPTAAAALEALYGPPYVPVVLPERVPVPARWFSSVPPARLQTHLALVYVQCGLQRRHRNEVAEDLAYHRSSIARHYHTALVEVCALLYSLENCDSVRQM